MAKQERTPRHRKVGKTGMLPEKVCRGFPEKSTTNQRDDAVRRFVHTRNDPQVSVAPRKPARKRHPSALAALSDLTTAHLTLCAMVAGHLDSDMRPARQPEPAAPAMLTSLDRSRGADANPPAGHRRRRAPPGEPYVFVSYKRERRKVAALLVARLRRLGIPVWWDQDIAATGPFRDVIERKLDGARAVIVLWCKGAIGSDFVRAEASHALGQGKLVNTHCSDITRPGRQLPKPFGETHSVRADDIPAIATALHSLGVPSAREPPPPRRTARAGGRQGVRMTTDQHR